MGHSEVVFEFFLNSATTTSQNSLPFNKDMIQLTALRMDIGFSCRIPLEARPRSKSLESKILDIFITFVHRGEKRVVYSAQYSGKSMAKLYILGGRERGVELRERTEKHDWCLYKTALILEVDTETGAVQTCLEYESPREVRAGDRPAGNFHAGALVGDTLYACTTTEVLIYRLPGFRQIGYISLPCFNDVHHVTPSLDGNLLVVTTGLDMVVKITPQGETISEWSVIGEPPWTRFSSSIDYRKVGSTKPHAAHPNFVFELDDEVWATRAFKRDAICLNRPGKRIVMDGEMPHDGLVCGDQILFTGIDGKVVIVDRRTLQVCQMIDLRKIQDNGKEVLPAWCRGLLPVDERRMWVGFSRIRKTIFTENVRWVKTILREGTIVKPTHIALFDVVSQQCLQEIDLESYGMNGIYGIFPAYD